MPTSKRRRSVERVALPVMKVAGPVLVTGLVVALAASGPARAEDGVTHLPRVARVTTGLFCAPPEGTHRPAPGTLAGWIHVPDQPVQMIAEGRVVPAVIGVGFGLRYTLTDAADATVVYALSHPPMPPSGVTSQSWDGAVRAGSAGTIFFQFDTEAELQPGAWRFTARIGDEEILSADFTVVAPAQAPELAGLCRGGALLSFSPSRRDAAG